MKSLLFLSWESPWPARNGAALRTLGLLKELSKVFDVDLVLITRNPLSREQTEYLSTLASTLERIPLKGVSFKNKLDAAQLMLAEQSPYHCAILRRSLRQYPDLQRKITQYPGVVFTSLGHWGTLKYNQKAPNWILNQCDADIDFWRVYASQASDPLVRIVALINWCLCARHFPQIYRNVGRILSVCDEDKQLTAKWAPNAQIDVIENGVDCTYYAPNRLVNDGQHRLLFTGTSVARNITALRWFVTKVLPTIQISVPDVQLLVGGDFNVKSQTEFRSYPALKFSGRVDDMRPLFNESSVYIAPFVRTHGSKLKIAEAAAMGMPIISTQQGIRGFKLVNNESALVADSADQFAKLTIDLLQDTCRQERLRKAVRQYAVTNIDWSILGARVIDIVKFMTEAL